MLDVLDIGIENAIAFRIGGKITKSQMDRALLIAKEKTEKYGNIVVLEEITSFDGIEVGAIVDEFKYLIEVGMSNITKVAIVTDKNWISKIVKLDDKIFKNTEMKCFSLSEKELAIEFLKGTA